MNREKLLEQNKHIPTSEILQDIADTETEIEQMGKEAEHLASTPMGMKDTRWNHMRADARKSGIEERKKFVKKLKSLLKAREELKK